MLFAYKPHKSLPIPPALGIETECSTSSARFKSRDGTPWPTQLKSYKRTSKFLATNLAIFRPLKNLAMSWSDDCHGNPLARITALSSTSSILLLQAQKEVMQRHLPLVSATHQPDCLYSRNRLLSLLRVCWMAMARQWGPSATNNWKPLYKSLQGKFCFVKLPLSNFPFLLCLIYSLSCHLFNHIPNLLPSPDIICPSLLSEEDYWYKNQVLAVLI